MTAGVRYWGVIPAAGAGRRFGGVVPKQYLELNGRRVIEHSIGALLGHPSICGCMVALSPEDEWWPQTHYAEHPSVERVAGGAERSDSVASALEVLGAKASAEDWVLVHDAARPCLTRADLDQLIAALDEESVGALLAVPVHDTVKTAAGHEPARVEQTLPRHRLWRAFTPQAFLLGQLQAALRHCRTHGVAITDDASAIEHLGLQPRLIEGRADNIKITRPEDLPLAQFFLDQQRQQDLR
jgi:2-C-methyl-D-erythritol 4-phosphate cytidylyltransferase